MREIERDDVTERVKRRVRITRDGILFVSGLVGVGYETVISKTDRPTLLLLFGAMMGLPAFLRKDERDQAKEDDDVPPDRASHNG